MEEPTLERKPWKLKDGRTVSYYKVGEWSFSNLPEEDFDYEMILETIEAWKTWGEFVKNNPHLSAGAAVSGPEQPEQDEAIKMSVHINNTTAEAYKLGYNAGFKDGLAKNAPPF